MKHIALLLSFIALLVNAEIGYAQDSLTLFGHGKITIDGGFQYLSINDDAIKLPDFIQSEWRAKSGNVYRQIDNPLLHGASYTDIDAIISPINPVRIHANFIFEHRGFSYGVYPTNNMIVYPKLNIAADTAANILGQRLEFHVSTGNVTDGRVYEGLEFYNIDWQGTIFSIKWEYFKLQFHKIGDLEYGVGLGLNDANDLILSAEELPLFGNWRADVAVGNTSRPFSYNWAFFERANEEYGKSISLGIYPSEDFRVYGEYGWRIKEKSSSMEGDRAAWLAGVSGKGTIGPLSLEGRAEYRHYGDLYNYMYESSYNTSNPQYHDFPSSYGEHLYPLSHYLRPFSQWAVFTEYQNVAVDGISLTLKAVYRLPWDLIVYGAFDLTEIRPGDGEWAEHYAQDFTWAFYDLGIGWSPRDDISLRWTYTNKGMNLERHYATFYMFKGAAMHMAAEYRIPVIQW